MNNIYESTLKDCQTNARYHSPSPFMDLVYVKVIAILEKVTLYYVAWVIE